jgi:hypothetical protein
VLRSGSDEHTLAQVFVAISAATDSVCSSYGTRHKEEVVLLASLPVLRSLLVPLETPCTLYTFAVSLSWIRPVAFAGSRDENVASEKSCANRYYAEFGKKDDKCETMQHTLK